MKTSYLGLMVKRLNRVENTIDNFDDLTSNVANYLFGQDQEGKTDIGPRQLEDVEIIGSILMSMMLPGLIVATFFLVIKVLVSLASHIKSKRLGQIVAPNKYKKLNKMIKLDPEMLALPRKQKKRQTCMFSIRILLTVMMVMSVFVIFLTHCYIWNKWGANIDSVNNFIGDSPISMRELHGKMKETLDTVSTQLDAVQLYMSRAMVELSQLTSIDVQEIIESKIERVTTKGAEFSDLASILDNFVINSDNKTLSIFLSLCYMTSSLVSMWFWYLVISYKFEHHLGWFAAIVWWCSTFLMFVLMNLYSTMFIPYITTVIQSDASFILDIIGAKDSAL